MISHLIAAVLMGAHLPLGCCRFPSQWSMLLIQISIELLPIFAVLLISADGGSLWFGTECLEKAEQQDKT
jgi:hypothetical protein